jgi:cell division septation protein DedD
MHGVFDEEEYQPVQRRRDTEVTLGPTLLLVVFFGLVLICGLCFGLGYTMGSRGSKDSVTASQVSAAGTSSVNAGSRPKPSATAPNIAGPPPQRTVVPLPGSGDSGANPAPVSPAANPSSGGGGNSSQLVVKPALQPQPVSPQSAPTVRTQPAALPAAGLMVQIAAVSHQEDADVLTSALRKRGYAVATHREADGLIHVQVGPFASRNDALAMRQKLLNDGYNAIVQQ